MRTIVKIYGGIIEITTIEKDSPKVCIYRARKRRSVYGPRRPDNIKRTKQICLRRMLSALKEFGCPLLVTLTFNGDASDASYANDALRKFQVRLQSEFNNAQSIFVPELSRRGRIHFHGLIFNVPLHLGDKTQGRRVISVGTERQSRIIQGLWGEGFVDARQTDGSPKLVYYISKYITKGGGETMFNAMRILRTSNGFPKEVIYRDEFAEFISKLYHDRKIPFNTWEYEHPFTGKIKKEKYLNGK